MDVHGCKHGGLRLHKLDELFSIDTAFVTDMVITANVMMKKKGNLIDNLKLTRKRLATLDIARCCIDLHQHEGDEAPEKDHYQLKYITAIVPDLSKATENKFTTEIVMREKKIDLIFSSLEEWYRFTEPFRHIHKFGDAKTMLQVDQPYLDFVRVYLKGMDPAQAIRSGDLEVKKPKSDPDDPFAGLSSSDEEDCPLNEKEHQVKLGHPKNSQAYDSSQFKRLEEVKREPLQVPKKYHYFQLPDALYGMDHPVMDFLKKFVESVDGQDHKKRLKQQSSDILDDLQKKITLTSGSSASGHDMPTDSHDHKRYLPFSSQEISAKK